MKENGEEAPDGRKVLSIPEWQREILAERLRDQLIEAFASLNFT